ncbi:MAG: VOC family protein [Thermomicrobiales bacterium]|nr:VOC family protein [Thermomicrobiales bacterium]
MTQKIVPCLWFDGTAEEATNFYVSLFEDSEVLDGLRDPETGNVISTSFRIYGQQFMTINGGPIFKLSEATSFMIQCESQEEVDRLWDALTADGGEESQCGWLKDKFGLSWQITPTRLLELVSGPDPEGAARATQAMLKMQKIDIATIERAYAGE